MDHSWHNPKSKWRKMYFRRLVSPLLAAAAFFFNVVLMVVLGVVISRLSPVEPFNWRVSSIFFGFGAICLIAALFSVRSFRRMVQLKRDVLATDGRVCPWCRAMMAEPDEDDMVMCAKCNVSMPSANIRQYWADFSLNHLQAIIWHEEHHPRSGRWLRKWINSTKSPANSGRFRWPWAVLGILPVLLITGMVWWMTGNPYFTMIFGTLVIAMSVGGSYLAWRFQPGQDKQRYCASCDYQLAPTEVVSDRCPECAAVWTAPGAVYSGKRFDHRKFTAMNVGMTLMMFFIIFGMGPLWTTARISSDAKLMSKVVTGRGFLFDEWTELNARTLSPEQTVELARGLMDRREKRATLERNAYDWLFMRIAAGELPQELADEVYSGIIKSNVIAPQRARVGEEIVIGFENVNRFQDPLTGVPQPAALFSGYFVGDDPTPHGRASNVQPIVGFGTRIISHGQTQMGYDGMSAKLTIVPERAGPLKIQVRYWLVGVAMAAGGMSQPIQWNDDGTPVLPAGTAWAYEHVLEATIDVQD
ncbi:MAG TPA: hypothetical protein PK400_03545 [Phycisphaerales bacterium]|nr:hypothetical protein [Phycisphaerales bacterium]HRQ75518.1 hypothetical protein [Phycisphaerales bacterium]